MSEESSTLLAEGRCAQDGESVKQLPCRHAYHAPCIDQWLVVSKVMTVSQPACCLLAWIDIMLRLQHLLEGSASRSG